MDSENDCNLYSREIYEMENIVLGCLLNFQMYYQDTCLSF